jgi:hypothetical protein
MAASSAFGVNIALTSMVIAGCILAWISKSCGYQHVGFLVDLQYSLTLAIGSCI